MSKECLPWKIQTDIPRAKGPFPNPRGVGLALGPRDEVWIFQGKHSLFIEYTFQFGKRRILLITKGKKLWL